MNKHAAAKKSVFEAPMTYLMVAVLFAGLMVGAMLPSYAGPATTEKVVDTHPYVTKPILPALPLGESFERFDK